MIILLYFLDQMADNFKMKAARFTCCMGTVLLCSLAYWCLAMPASCVAAQSIGINGASDYLSAFAFAMSPETMEGVVTQANWNNIGTDNANESSGYIHTNLVDSSGEASGAGVTLILDPNGPNGTGNTIIGNGSGLSGFQLFKGGLTSHYGRAPLLIVTNIPYASYDVINYVIPNGLMGATLVGEGTNGVFTNAISFSTASGNFGIFDDATMDGSGNYIQWHSLTGATFKISIIGSGERRYFSALQIVDLTPEPPWTALLMLLR